MSDFVDINKYKDEAQLRPVEYKLLKFLPGAKPGTTASPTQRLGVEYLEFGGVEYPLHELISDRFVRENKPWEPRAIDAVDFWAVDAYDDPVSHEYGIMADHIKTSRGADALAAYINKLLEYAEELAKNHDLPQELKELRDNYYNEESKYEDD